MTRDEFINHEIAQWGYDEVDSLLERGYTPKLTTQGWRWFYVGLDVAPIVESDELIEVG